MDLGKQFRADSSALFLVISNLVTIIFAVYEKWSLSEIMWIYWGQSVIIGYFNYRRIMDLRQFSTDGFEINNKPAKPTRATKVATANFFALHYGLFHFVYLVFLFKYKDSKSSNSILFIIMGIVIFLYNHRFSYFHNKARDMNRVPNIGTIMFFPYLRIIPMHITIIIGGAFVKGSGALIIFLGLKTLADLIMHMIEHAEARQKSNTFFNRK